MSNSGYVPFLIRKICCGIVFFGGGLREVERDFGEYEAPKSLSLAHKEGRLKNKIEVLFCILSLSPPPRPQARKEKVLL